MSNIIRTCKDPHHNGINIWGWSGQNFYIRSETQSKWTKVNKVHITPNRVVMFSWLMNGDEAAQ